MALQCEGTRIRTICPDSPAARHLDVAPQVGERSLLPREKPPGYVSDLIQVPNYAHSGAAAGKRWWRAKLAYASLHLNQTGRA